MILPTKHISVRNSLLGLGSTLLKALHRPCTVTALWDKTRDAPETGTFERFSLALALLYAVGAVDSQDGLLRRCAG